MDLNLTEEQEMLKRSARELLKQECPTTLVRAMESDPRGVPLALWKKLADTGWQGIAFPEKYGGGGQKFLDLIVLLEETGRAMLPGPFLQTVAICGMAILEFGDEARRQRFLPGIAKGETMMSLAHVEPDGAYEEVSVATSATAQDAGFRLNGTKLFVQYANVVDYLLVVARTGGRKDSEEGVTLFLVDAHAPGVETELLQTRAKVKFHEVRFKDVAVPRENVLGQVGKGWPIVERIRTLGAAAQCAELAGMCGAVTDMTIEYAKNRVQFGRPIGSFQQVQMRCSDMWGDAEGTRYITYEAAWRLSEGLPALKEVALAKSYVNDATRRVLENGHQVHGAVGLTDEHDLTMYNRRHSSAAANFGDSTFYREVAAKEMGL